MRFELTTLTLARLCSTPELRPHSVMGLLAGDAQHRKGDFGRACAEPRKAKGGPKAACFDWSGR